MYSIIDRIQDQSFHPSNSDAALERRRRLRGRVKKRERIIGRTRESAKLRSAIDRAREGSGGIVLVAGEAGVGKTRLAEAVLAEAAGGETGLRVFTGRIREEATSPFAPIAAVLRDYLRRTKGRAIQRGPFTDYLALLLPELGNPPEELDDDTLIEAISSTFATAARKTPVAVFLDDLHWADNATLELLPALADRLQDEPVVILGTYRNDEIPRAHPIRRTRNELRRRQQLNEIVVEPFSGENSEQLIERVFGEKVSRPLVDLIREKSRDVPLYVEELSYTLTSSGLVCSGDSGVDLVPGGAVPIPDSIRDVVLLRMDGLSQRARSHLEVAAVVGTEFDLDFVAELAGDDKGIDELFDHNFVEEVHPGRGAFRHALTREAVQDEIVWSKRRSLNRRIAERLEQSGAVPELVAERWLAANELDRARGALLESAERSCSMHAYRDAANAANRALEIWPEGQDEGQRLDALERLAHCAEVSGQLNDAVRALREVAESPVVDADHRRRGEATRSLATIYGLQGLWEQAMETRRASAENFRKAGDEGEAAAEWLAAARHLTAMLHYSSAIDTARKAARIASEAKRQDVQARALGLEGNVLAMQGMADEGRKTVMEGLSLALQQNDVDAASEAYRRLGSVLEYSADYAGSRDVYFKAIDFCQAQGVDSQANVCMGCMSWVLYRTGEWKSAAEMCRAVLVAHDSPAGSRSTASGVLGLIRVQRGEFKQARQNLTESLQLARQHETLAMEMIDLWGLAKLLEEEGDDDGAAAGYLRVLDLRDEIEDRHDALLALMSAVTFFATRRREAEVARCTNALASIASETGNTEALAALALALGETALLAGDAGEATKQFALSLSQFERLETPLEQAVAAWRLGVAAAAADRAKEAARHLTNGYRIARKLGARPLAARFADQLNALGAPAEKGRGADRSKHPGDEHEPAALTAGLTPRQLEVTRLISDGLTNKEIAHKLFLSTRTVDMHVANILNRLDCRSRSEAVRKAGELGLLG